MWDTFITKDSGERQQFPTGMQRDTNVGKARFDLMFPLDVPYKYQIITRFAEILGRWAIKYNERNWEKAETQEELNRFKESAARHFSQRLCWETDEDHMAATMFNLMWAELVKYKMSLKSN
jgi:hypothetical protein